MIDVGIAEQHAATMSAALAMEGMKPVYAVYSTFLQRAYDQVVHDICRHNANVIFAIDRAGFVGGDGETHQGVYDIAYLRHIPNLVLMMPKDENELRRMMATAVAYGDGPIAIRYPREQGRGVAMDEELAPIPIGSWEVVRDGDYAAILAIGPMVHVAEEAAELLKREGLNVRVVNARFVKPLDAAMLAQLAKERLPMLVLEETAVAGGLGSAILEHYAQQGLKPTVQLAGVPDRFIEHATIKEQRAEVGLTAEEAAKHLRSFALLKRQRQTAN